MSGLHAQNGASYWLKIAVLSIMTAAFFQVYLRYEYVTGFGTTWRIDRVTQQACEMRRERAVCTVPSPPTYKGSEPRVVARSS